MDLSYLSLSVAVAAVVVAALAYMENRNTYRIQLMKQTLEMYSDIGYGNPFNWMVDDPRIRPDFRDSYMGWLKRFMSYNGMVNAEIQEDYNTLVNLFTRKLEDSQFNLGDADRIYLHVRDYSRERARILANRLRDSI